MRVLVLGGLGNFGARICRRLACEEGFEIIAGSRNPPATSPFAEANIHLQALDMNAADFVAQLRALAPQLLVHCAGPFQHQGYSVARACCEAGVHYIDIADGRAFVSEFGAALDDVARNAGVLLVSGASSVPGLSSAVVDRLRERFSQLAAISTVIAPGQQAPRGEATMQAVLGYAGQPFPRLADGVWTVVHGWQDLERFRIADLGQRWAAACDVPDLALFPQRYPEVATVTFRAALELRAQHLALWCVAALRRLGVPIPLHRHARRLDAFTTRYLDRFGSDHGGMLVRLSGRLVDGRRGHVAWHLSAPNGDGPEIPCMAAVLLALRLARGDLATRGAQPCMGLLQLEDFTAEFQRWAMTTWIEEERQDDA